MLCGIGVKAFIGIFSGFKGAFVIGAQGTTAAKLFRADTVVII